MGLKIACAAVRCGIACAVESGQKKRGLFALKHARLISQNRHNIFHPAHFFLLDLNLALNIGQLGCPHPSLQEQSIGREEGNVSQGFLCEDGWWSESEPEGLWKNNGGRGVCIIVKQTLERETDSNYPGGIWETTNSPQLGEK